MTSSGRDRVGPQPRSPSSSRESVDVEIVSVGDGVFDAEVSVPLRTVAHPTTPIGLRLWGRTRAIATAPATWEFSLDCGAILVLVAITYYYFAPSLITGMVAIENDTRVFYYPIFLKLAEAWRSGRLPLWSPDILTGYPLFADGEAGVLYPIHLLALTFLKADDAFLWLRPIRFLLGGAFMFAFMRSLGTGRPGSLVGAVTFSFGGFSIAQMHHVNIGTGAIWLPLCLCFAERALQQAGRARYTYALLAAIPFGMQGLIVHVQVLIMSAIIFALYVGYRVTVGPVGGDSPVTWLSALLNPRSTSASVAVVSPIAYLARRTGRLTTWIITASATMLVSRLFLLIAIVGISGTIGASLSSIQLIPLFELGTFSFRGSGVDYSFATEYELPVSHFLSFLLPDAFMTASWPEEARRYWGLWSRWEVFGYVGITPLCLAPFGLLFGSSRTRWLFGLLIVASLALAVGEHAPFGAHKALSTLPGFSALRAPGRFVLISTLGFAVLSGLGIDALARRWRWSTSRETDRTWHSVTTEGTLTVLLGGLQLSAIVAPIALSFFSTYAENHKDQAMEFLQRQFVVMRGFDTRLNIEQLYQFALASLDIAQPEVARQFLFLVASVVVLSLWDRVRILGAMWQLCLLLILVVDLTLVGQSFHPTMPLTDLKNAGPLGTIVGAQPGMSATSGASYRVFTRKNSRDEPNRMLLAGVSEANGYSSLEPDRHTRYVAAAWYAPNRLLDLMGVRYFAVPSTFKPLPSFNLASFDTDRPLFSSTGRNGASLQTVRFGQTSGDSVRIISTMRWASTVPQGQTVARLSVVHASGARTELTMVAGVHTAAWDWERPELAGKVPHQMPSAERHARTWQELDVRARPAGKVFPAHLYYSEFPLDGVTPLDRIEITFTHPTAQVEIFGIAIFNDTTKDLEQASLARNASFRQIYADSDAVLYENAGALPRTFLVPAGVIANAPDEALQRMAQGDWSPERLVVLEADTDAPQTDAPRSTIPTSPADLVRRLPPALKPTNPPSTVTFDLASRRSTSIVGSATISRLDPEAISIGVDAKANCILVLNDLFYPGWQARIDGQATPVFRANYLFRGVFVPQGVHTIDWEYRPRSFRLGLMVTLLGVAVLLGGLIVMTVPIRWKRPRRLQQASEREIL